MDKDLTDGIAHCPLLGLRNVGDLKIAGFDEF
jgi:hypothetical protein